MGNATAHGRAGNSQGTTSSDGQGVRAQPLLAGAAVHERQDACGDGGGRVETTRPISRLELGYVGPSLMIVASPGSRRSGNAVVSAARFAGMGKPCS